MTRSNVPVYRSLRLALVLPLALTAAPLLAQYRFNMASVSSQATSKSQATTGAPYFDSEFCIASSCSGANLSPSGFHDNGESKIDTEDGNGVVISLAHGTSQNNTTMSTGGGIHLSISSNSSAYASAELAGGSASSPFAYKAPFRDGTSMTVSWDVNTASWLTVSGMQAVANKVLRGGAGWSTATWIINVQLHDGTIVAQYTPDNSPPSFTAQIPANTMVSIGWSALTAAQATCGAFGVATSASTTAQVSGEISIDPIGS